jgi:hypothetical protein
MRKLLLTTTLIGTTLIAPGLVPQAQAHDWLSVGGGFRVGAAHISFVFGGPGAHYGPAYYYRYDRPIRYRGHSCNRYCFRESGHYYHHEACPLVHAHFRAYDVDPYWAYSRYAPRHDYGYRGHYDGYYSGGGYSRGGGYYGGDRYDRRDRYSSRGDRSRDGYYRDGRRYDRRHRDGHYRDRHDRRDRYDDRHRGRGRGHREHRHHRGCGH